MCVVALILSLLVVGAVHAKELLLHEHNCSLSATLACPYSAITNVTRIYPGGNTYCADKSEYSFQVFPGKTNRVILHFQEGGGCFDAETCEPALNDLLKKLTGKAFYHAQALPRKMEGIFDRDDLRNPFREDTIVHILYCSADVHLGKYVKSSLVTPRMVHHNGANNVESVLTWFYRNFPSPSDLIITGSSAGSIVAQVWSGVIIDHYKTTSPGTKLSVIADSYVGLLPRERSGRLSLLWGVCESKFKWTNLLKQQCIRGDLYFADYIQHTIQSNPDVPFAFINSKHDMVQRLFYCLVKESIDFSRIMETINCLPPKDLYEGNKAILEQYGNSDQKNVLQYFVDGSQHVYLSQSFLYYTARTNAQQERVGMKLVDWIAKFVQVRGDPEAASSDESPPEEEPAMSSSQEEASSATPPRVTWIVTVSLLILGAIVLE